jgi:hypothetical protein
LHNRLVWCVYKGYIGDITFYKHMGKWLARKKHRLIKRVKTDAAFSDSRRASAGFGVAAKLAKEIYLQLPAHKRGRGVIGKITGQANTMLHNGSTAAEAKLQILKWLNV